MNNFLAGPGPQKRVDLDVNYQFRFASYLGFLESRHTNIAAEAEHAMSWLHSCQVSEESNF